MGVWRPAPQINNALFAPPGQMVQDTASFTSPLPLLPFFYILAERRGRSAAHLRAILHQSNCSILYRYAPDAIIPTL
jgi:hypothetical protein